MNIEFTEQEQVELDKISRTLMNIIPQFRDRLHSAYIDKVTDYNLIQSLTEISERLFQLNKRIKNKGMVCFP